MEEERSQEAFGALSRLTIFLFVVLFTIVILRVAWLCDDAYVTLRTCRNFLEGEGLRWNLAERVQTYTHPLWMFTLTAAYGLTGESYYTLIFLSVALSVATVWTLAMGLSVTPRSALVALLILIFSKAFTDYSSSGLENPLSHLILVAFCVFWYRSEGKAQDYFTLGLLACLAALNRLDTILFYVPALLSLVASNRSLRCWGALALGFLPLVVWELFSLFYYGFPFPNTAYAKLNTGLPAWGLAAQGLTYYLNLLRLDMLTVAAIACGCVLPFMSKDRKSYALAFGMMLYLAYVIKIGGDFMAGRFFSIAVLCAVVIIARTPGRIMKSAWWPSAAVVILLGLAGPYTPILSKDSYGASHRKTIIDRHGVADERAFYYRRTGLLTAEDSRTMPDVAPGYLSPEIGQHGIIVSHNIGMMGFYGAEREAYILDEYALGNALLARLPVRGRWRIGHYRRAIPVGYLDTLGQGANRIEDPGLAKYNEKLDVVIRGDLYDPVRLRTILDFNLGRYDHLIEPYVDSL